MSEGVLEVTTDKWESEVLKASGLVMIDFWAVWCGPCRIIAPAVEELSKEYTGKVKFLKLNTDENPDKPIQNTRHPYFDVFQRRAKDRSDRWSYS